MEIKVDGSNQDYIEIPLKSGYSLRLTVTEKLWKDEHATSGIRIQFQDKEGKVWPGPEIPILLIPEVIKGLATLGIVRGMSLNPGDI